MSAINGGQTVAAGVQENSGAGLSASELCRNAITSGGAVLLVPGLLASLTPELDSLDTRLLRRLLGLARRPDVQAGETLDEKLAQSSDAAQMVGLEQLVMSSLQPQQLGTCAALLSYAVDFPGQPGANVLRADPAYQQIDMNNATLTDPSLLELSADECNSLLQTLNEHFAEDGMRFEYKQTQRWYCHFDASLSVETISLSTAIGHDVSACRPTGTDARQWRSKLAEVEMLLFEHPVNEARQAQGQLPVNTLWLWGEGQCDATVPVPVVNIATDDFYTQSLATFNNLHCISLNDSELEPAKMQSDAMMFVVSQVAISAATDDLQARQQELLWLEKTISKVLWQHLKQDHWPVIVIWCGGNEFFEVHASVKNKFWRKAWRNPKPLSSFVAVDENAQELSHA